MNAAFRPRLPQNERAATNSVNIDIKAQVMLELAHHFVVRAVVQVLIDEPGTRTADVPGRAPCQAAGRRIIATVDAGGGIHARRIAGDVLADEPHGPVAKEKMHTAHMQTRRGEPAAGSVSSKPSGRQGRNPSIGRPGSVKTLSHVRRRGATVDDGTR